MPNNLLDYQHFFLKKRSPFRFLAAIHLRRAPHMRRENHREPVCRQPAQHPMPTPTTALRPTR
jgi:hypothetical protein